MKRFLCGVLCLILVVSISLTFIACKNEVAVDSTLENNKGDAISGLSAYTIASSAYYYWKDGNCGNYRRTETIDFSAAGGLAARKSRQIYIVNGAEICSERITKNSGLAGSNNADILYYDGANTYYSEVGADSVPGDAKKSDEEYTVNNIWGNYTALTEEEGVQKRQDVRKMLTTYDLSSKDYLTEDSDDTVYEYAPDKTKYLCTITIDCSKEAFNGVQSIAKKEFIDGLGCKENSLEMEIVKITFLLEKVENQYRVVQWSSYEKYSGVKGVARTACAQTYSAVFSYEASDYATDLFKPNTVTE